MENKFEMQDNGSFRIVLHDGTTSPWTHYTGIATARDKRGSLWMGVSAYYCESLPIEQVLEVKEPEPALLDKGYKVANCGCHYHAEQGIPCEHDIALNKKS